MPILDKNKIDEKILCIHETLSLVRKKFSKEENFPDAILMMIESTLLRIGKISEKTNRAELKKIHYNLNNLSDLLVCFTDTPLLSGSLYQLLNELKLFIFIEKEVKEKNTSHIKFRYDQEVQILTSIEEIKCSLIGWTDIEFLPKIQNILDEINQEFTSYSIFKSNDQEIMALRKSLALLILQVDLSEKISNSNKNDIINFLNHLMSLAFTPTLQIKSSRLRSKKHRYDPVLDINTLQKEVVNLPLNEIDPLYENALKELVQNFDFYITAFNLNYSDTFQEWAKNHHLRKDILIFSESLRIAILCDADQKLIHPHSPLGCEIIDQKISEWFEGLEEAAKTNNPELIYSDVLHNLKNGAETYAHDHCTLKQNFSFHFANAIVTSPVKDKIIKYWRRDSEKTFDECFDLIWKSIKKHANFYQTFFGVKYQNESYRWVTESKERMQLLIPLWTAFHYKELLLEAGSYGQYPLEKFNEIKIANFLQTILEALEKKDSQILKNAFYLGKGKLKYIHWQLLDALYLLAIPHGDKILSEWKPLIFSNSHTLFAKSSPNEDEKFLSKLSLG